MLVMMPSGTNMCLGDRCGMHFWGVYDIDGIWHLAIQASSFRQYPFIVPTYSGAFISGYNILMDLIIYAISLIGIPPVFILFKLVPIFWFLLYTFLAIILARSIKDSALFVGLILFFLYFADHFGYLIQLYHHGSIFLGSQSFALQSLTSLLNTQFALSLPFIMLELILIKKQKFSDKYSLLFAFSIFIAMGLKFYGGVIAVIIGFFYIIESILYKQKFIAVCKISIYLFLFTVASIFIFYNPLQASKTGSVFAIVPFATVHSVIEAANMVYLPDMVNARYFLYEHGWGPRLIYIEVLSAMLYFFFNFGTRIFGVLFIMGKIIFRKVSRFEFYILSTVLFSYLLSIMLVQKGDWWNTVQFGYYGIFLSNFLLAIFLVTLIDKHRIKGIVISGIIILLTIPSALRTIIGLGRYNSSYIPKNELIAMEYLKKQTDGVVFNSFSAPDRYPFLDYRNSGYVSAFTNKQLFLAQRGTLNIIGMEKNFDTRNERIKKNDCNIFDEVDYIYYVIGHDDSILKYCKRKIQKKFKKGFSNEGVVILQQK